VLETFVLLSPGGTVGNGLFLNFAIPSLARFRILWATVRIAHMELRLLGHFAAGVVERFQALKDPVGFVLAEVGV
jgi:hypothetical protein